MEEKLPSTEYIFPGRCKTMSSAFYGYILVVVHFQLHIQFMEFFNMNLRDPDYRYVGKICLYKCIYVNAQRVMGFQD